MKISPKWVYEKPHPNGAAVRYTPKVGNFRDAEWVEPRGQSTDSFKDKTYSLINSGSVRVLNSTFVATFEKNDFYQRWVPNPARRSRLLEMIGFRPPHKYWIIESYDTIKNDQKQTMTIDPITAERVITLLENLTIEHTGWKRFFVRYRISDIPLRSDAKNILDFLRQNEAKVKS
jgi:hypothetical protein